MLVFIDESGDPGFKLNKGSSENFVLAMAVFKNNNAANEATRIISTAQSQNRVKPEWKFSKCKDVKRDAFFDAVAACQFECRAIVVKKHLIRSHILRTKPTKFYNFFTNKMCSNDGGVLNDAKVIIDGSGDRTFKREFQSYLKREIPNGKIKSVAFKDSRRDPLIQLADMCAGAIARSYTEKTNHDRWVNILKNSGHIQDIWEFQ